MVCINAFLSTLGRLLISIGKPSVRCSRLLKWCSSLFPGPQCWITARRILPASSQAKDARIKWPNSWSKLSKLFCLLGSLQLSAAIARFTHIINNGIINSPDHFSQNIFSNAARVKEAPRTSVLYQDNFDLYSLPFSSIY